jgi:hypothetical protein
VVFVVRILNRGPDDAQNIVVEDAYGKSDSPYSDLIFPSYCKDSQEAMTCTILFLSSGERFTFTYSAKINSDADSGGTVSYISAYSDQADYDQRDNWAKVHFSIVEEYSEDSLSPISINNPLIEDQQDEQTGGLFSEEFFFEPMEIEITDESLDSFWSLVGAQDSQDNAYRISQDALFVPDKTVQSGQTVWLLAILSIFVGLFIRLFKRKPL